MNDTQLLHSPQQCPGVRRHKVPTPQEVFNRELERLASSAQLLAELQPPAVLEWVTLTRTHLQQPHPSPETPCRLIEVTNTVLKPVDCPECGQQFQDELALRSHMRSSHKILLREDTQDHILQDYAHFSVQGMPTCMFCRHPFCSWPQFSLHVAYAQCTGLLEHKARRGVNFFIRSDLRILSVSRLSTYRRSARYCEGTWYHLLSVPEVKTKLENHCPFCDKFLLRAGYIKTHIMQKHVQHGEALRSCEARVRKLTTARPCCW